VHLPCHPASKRQVTMKFQALCAVAMASGVEAIASNPLGMGGEHPISVLEMIQKRPHPVPENQVGPMLKSAESMLMDLARSHKGTPLTDLVDQIKPFIRQMQDSINNAHSSAQQNLNNMGSGFTGCNDAKSSGDAQAADLENTTSSHSRDHKACRTRQKTADDNYNACDSTLQAEKGAKDSSCQVYEDSKLEPGCHAIPPNDGETWEQYVTRAAIWFPQTRDTFLHNKEVCENNTKKWEDQRDICLGPNGSGGGLKKILDDTTEECDGIQHSLETATCSYVTKVRTVCEAFGVCVNTLADSFDSQKQGIEELEHQRQVEWNATERLLCLLDVYGADGGVDATKLQTCQNIADNTTHLRLTWPTPTPRPAQCADYLPHPCNPDYTQQEYAGMDAPAGTCTPCSFPSVPGAAAGPSAPFLLLRSRSRVSAGAPSARPALPSFPHRHK